jgi:hypothetical protein
MCGERGGGRVVSLLPTLGLVVNRPPSDGFAGLVTDLARWCRPVVIGNGMAPPAAWLSASPIDEAPSRAPLACWVDDADAIDTDAGRIAVTRGRLDGLAVECLSPFVRSRYRRARGLPERMVIDMADIPGDLAGTALALASAVIVGGDRVVDALARGAPVVTDAASADAAGAGPDDVVIGGWAEAEAIAADLHRAAALSANARALFDRRHDRGRAPRQVAAALGLVRGAERALNELQTPWTSRVRDRTLALLP